MMFNSPSQIAELAIEAGVKKAKMSVPNILILSFFAGAFIAFGFMLDIKVTTGTPAEWGGFTSFLGAAVFPIGLVLTLLAGGELLTGNFMTVPMAWFARKISFGALLRNWILVLIGNFIGSIFVAYVFGDLAQIANAGPVADKVAAVATAKDSLHFGVAFASAIGCNWLVCLGVWLNFGAKDFAGKILGIWFPIMTFVAIGFQHVVANMYIVPQAIFNGAETWGHYFPNLISVLLGNIVGGAIFVGLAYFIVYKKDIEASQDAQVKKSA
ncbi:formate/nitrite transporter family protein [Pullulanibacillus sp. KACC 23026]|uniref:formate/nitrite transporter family protein n=1 Tax=Pullulanibacillus sp. KACC 23026 TaxID=3028315 RepID=UPI0023AFD885|nr:formate/nitrite transporter family protein [Pullulanibacillus sp. KACC 23026]WEG15049.1 formate/nitrite transporter family protein [Pullulanibacillus sp. KACC 23026]